MSLLLSAALPAATLLLNTLSTQAVVRTWIGGNSTWVDNGGNADWSGSDEPDSTDDALFDAANSVNLSSNQTTVLSLTLQGGIDLDTNSFDIDIDGTLTITGSSSNLIVTNSSSAVTAFDIATASTGQLRLDNGVVNMSNPGAGLNGIFTNAGTLLGRGTLNLNDNLAANTATFNNNGTITASAIGLIIIGNPPAGTLQINASDPTNARINLDGTGAESGVVNVNQNQTLDINVTLADQFNGTMNISQDATLDISTAWSIGTNAVMNANSGAVGSPFFIPKGVSHVAGATLTQSGGTINVVDTDGTLQFDAVFSMTGGDLVNNGLVVFNNTATIGAGANFTMPGADASLTVNAGVTATVNQADFNPDGNGTATNVITVNSGGLLDLNLGAGADEGLGGTINLAGGTLSVTTASNTWTIQNALNATAGTSTVSGEELTFSSPTVTVSAGAVLNVTAPLVVSGGTYTGDGQIRFSGAVTYAANTTIAVANFDWDGSTSNSAQTINTGVTLTINSPTISNAFADALTIAGDGTLNISGPAAYTMNGSLTTNPANTGTATIAGTTHITMNNTFTVSGATAISSAVTFAAGNTTTVAAAGTLTVTGATTFAGSTIGGTGTYNPANTNTVTADSSITVANFNFDNTGSAAWTINPGVTLTVSVTDYDNTAPNLFQGTITLNSGLISVNTGDAEFIANGNINLNNTTGAIPTWSGEPIDFGDDLNVLDSNLNVGGAGVSIISAQVDFNSDADVNIAAGATLVLTNTTNFTPVNAANNAEFTGAGTFVLEGTAAVSETTTINMVGGTVDLDGRASDTVGNTINIDAPLVINAATLSPFGKANLVGTNVLDVNNNVGTGTLTVNLDSAASTWTLNTQGLLNLVNDNTNATLLFGSPVKVSGALNVTGEVTSAARLDIAGTVTINTAGEFLHLNGGNNSTDPNTLVGGTINGPGSIAANANRALFGFGTINAPVAFGLAAGDLRADNGILTINGAITSARNLGTADGDGILNVPAAWNSSVVTTVSMQGGELKGGAVTIDNPNGINGFGLVSSRVFNNTRIQQSTAGQTLVVETAANDNDWDGTTNAGQLRASGGTLELRDTATFSFQGGVTASGGGNVFTNGFALDFQPVSTIDLINGSLTQSTGLTTEIRGAVTVGVGPDSTIGTAGAGGTVRFRPTSVTTLNGNLRLDNPLTTVTAGATFSGAGRLINLATRVLSADNTATINAGVENQGQFTPASTAAGAVTVGAFAQTAAGLYSENLNGSALAQFDRVTVTNSIQLAGALDIVVAGAYDPVPYISHTIMTGASVTGNFATITGFAVTATKFLAVTYTPTQVLITAAIPGDLNLNGTIDPDDYAAADRGRAKGFSGWSNGDFNQNGIVNAADFVLIDTSFALQGGHFSPEFLALRTEQFGPDYLPTLLASIPEPSLLLYLLPIFPLSSRHRRPIARTPQ